MIPSAARAFVEKAVPDLTEITAKGIAVAHMANVEDYVGKVFQAVSSSFPPGLSYHGHRRLTPREQYAEATRARNSQRTYDTAKSSFYMVEYKFSYKENATDPNNKAPAKEFSRILYIPYVGEAGTMYISGSHYVVSPVLADRVFSIGQTTVFARLVKARLIFNRIPHAFRANNLLENQLVVWCNVYNEEKKPRNRSVRCNTTMAHYLFARYGVSGAFKRHLNVNVEIGGVEIDEQKYPSDKWVICTTTGVTPSGVRARRQIYRPTELRIAVKKEDYNTTVKQFIAGFFYVIDHYPDRMRLEYVDDPNVWKVLLGRALWDEEPSAGQVLADITEHYDSLDDYIDRISALKLAALGYPVRDIYDLFVVIIRKFSDWMAESPDRVSTMYDKELSILPFVCYCYVDQFNKLIYKLNAKRQRALTFNVVHDFFSKFLRVGMIFTPLSRECGLLSNASMSGDCMALRLTNILVPQNASNKARTRTRPLLTDPAKQLHASIAEVGAYSAMPKSAPDGRHRLNLCVRVDETGLIQRNPEYAELIEKVRVLIGR